METQLEEIITAIIVNFKTQGLTQKAVNSLRKFYPDIPLILIDNGSGDPSTQTVKASGADIVLLNKENIGHGPALNQGARLVRTPCFLTLDSDCEIKKGGFLEKMLEILQGPNHSRGIWDNSAGMWNYAVGWLRWVNRDGVSVPERQIDKGKHCPYVHPATGLYRLSTYLSLPPFSHDGAPAKQNMWRARDLCYRVYPFPVENFVDHLVAGTRRMFQGRWNPGDKESPEPWDPKRSFPI